MNDVYCWQDPIRERFLVGLILYVMTQYNTNTTAQDL